MIEVDGAGNTVRCEIGIRRIENGDPVDLARIDLNTQRISGSKSIFLFQAKRQSKPLAARKSGPQTQAAGRFFGHSDGQVNLIG